MKKINKMTKNEKELIGKLLKMASKEFIDFPCNDVPELWFKNWTKKERLKFVKECYKYNGDPNGYDPENLYVTDFELMSFLAERIVNKI